MSEAMQTEATEATEVKTEATETKTETTLSNPGQESKVIWPENWREEISGGDEKKLARAGRFDAPGKILDSYMELETKYKSADINVAFPDEGTDEEKAAWREQKSVPSEAAGYMEGLPDGLVIGEEDQAGMDVLSAKMHEINAPAPVVHQAMAAYYEHIENTLAEVAESDAQAKKDTDDELNTHWGADFRRNLNDMNAWLDSGGEEVKNAILSARGEDGKPLGSNPEVLKWLVGQMRDINPLVTVVGAGGGDPAAALDARIAEIEKVMRTDNAAYVKDQPMQDEYLKLLGAKEKSRARA